ncbi:MAG: hypothetical protein J3K34DRAFT_459010 [Monoraphidium minutum]|nr:MAG: hypothetical protein J3K34DRAFT_459010 [Monoraphidium minutum]
MGPAIKGSPTRWRNEGMDGAVEPAGPAAGSSDASADAAATPHAPDAAAAGAGGADAAAPRPAAAASEAAVGEDQFLCITVREARNLLAKDYETSSSDPFAKITLGPHLKKSRVIYRNRHPMWQQRLMFPLESLDEGEPLLVELWDKDFAGIEFLGQVIMTLGKALEIAQDPATGRAYWFPLAKKRSTDVVGGHLCLGFEVMDAIAYMQAAAEVEAEMDPEAIMAALGSRALHVQLHGLNGLRANNMALGVQGGGAAPAGAAASPRGGGAAGGGGCGKAKVGPRAKSLYIRFGRFCLEKPLPEDFDEGGEFEVAINEEVLIPLAPALRLGAIGARRKDELYDIKVYVKGSTHTIAKTQIPIWDVPRSEDDPSGGAEDEASGAGGALERGGGSGSGAPSGRATPQPGGRAATPPLTGSGRVTPPVAAGRASVAGADTTEAAGAAAALKRGGPNSPPLDRVSPPPSALSSPHHQPPCCAAGGDPCSALLCKKRAGGSGAAEPDSPQLGDLSGAPSGGAFSIPAHQPGDCSSDEDEGGGPVQRSAASESAGKDGPPSLARTSGGSAKGGGGGGGGGAAPAAAAAAAPAPARKRAGGASYSSGAGGSDLSRRLRSMLAPGAREVSRMGWAPLQASTSTGEDADGGGAPAAGGGAAAGPAGGGGGPGDKAAGGAVLAAGAWGDSWKGSGGKRYQRILESHLALGSNLEIAVSLRLVPLPPSPAAREAVDIAAEGDARVLEDDDDDEDVPDAAPLALPPALDIAVVDTTLNLGVNALYSLVFGGGSGFMAAFWAAEELRDVSVTPWGPPDPAAPPPGCAPGALRGRRVSYVKPLRIPIPMAPKQCNVWEEQRLLAKGDGGWVVECRSTNDAPKGDCFYVLVQLCGVHVASGAAQLRISMQMVFYKNCLGKGMIQAGAESDARRGWAALVATLQRHAAAAGPALMPGGGTRARAPAAAGGSGAGGGAAAGAGALAAAPGGGAKGRRMRALAPLAALARRAPGALALQPLLTALLAAAVLVLAAAVCGAGREVVSELRELTSALRDSRRACEAALGAAAALGGGA